jgi:hypothetical protein
MAALAGTVLVVHDSIELVCQQLHNLKTALKTANVNPTKKAKATK